MSLSIGGSETKLDTVPHTQLSSSTKNVSSFTLKLIAIIGMSCNHAAHILSSCLPSEIYTVCFGLGGLTFPLIAFLVVEGYRHTSNLKKYAMRLFIFALISQIPYWLFLGDNGNVLFTLLIGLGVLYCYDKVKSKFLFLLIFLIAVFGSAIFDWGSIGVLMIFLFYILKRKYARIVIPLLMPAIIMGPSVVISSLDSSPYLHLGDILYLTIGFVATSALLLTYKGRRGRLLKYFFYIYYPLHLFILGSIRILCFGIT